MLSVTCFIAMLGVVMLGVVMLSVLALIRESGISTLLIV
jgi:hypothetical protein